MSLIYRLFLKGLFTLLPISITVALITWIIAQVERLFAAPLRMRFPNIFGFPGAGIIFALILVLIAGVLVNTYFTRPFVQWIEAKLESLPVIRAIYGPIRDVTRIFADKESRHASQKVVMVQLGNGIEVLGLVTRDSFQDLPSQTAASDSVAVFIPFTFGMGGFTLIVARDRIRETGLTAERGMQLALTGWVKTSTPPEDAA
mgnify:CR=1 FL=1